MPQTKNRRKVDAKAPKRTHNRKFLNSKEYNDMRARVHMLEILITQTQRILATFINASAEQAVANADTDPRQLSLNLPKPAYCYTTVAEMKAAEIGQ